MLGANYQNVTVNVQQLYVRCGYKTVAVNMQQWYLSCSLSECTGK